MKSQYGGQFVVAVPEAQVPSPSAQVEMSPGPEINPPGAIGGGWNTMNSKVLAPVPTTRLTPNAYPQVVETLRICQPKERVPPAAWIGAAVVALGVREEARVVVSGS